MEEIEDLHAADGLANPCEDFLLGKTFYYPRCFWLHVSNASRHASFVVMEECLFLLFYC